MVASFYGHGERLSKHTAPGAVFNPHAYTAAHKTLPFGTHLRVCHHGCVTVVVNDRFSFVRWGSQCDIILPLRKDLKIQPLIDVDYHVEAGVDKITSFVYNKT